MPLPYGDEGWSAECDCGISWSYTTHLLSGVVDLLFIDAPIFSNFLGGGLFGPCFVTQ